MFIVLEIQKDGENPTAVLTSIYDDDNVALNKFYTICAAAAVSEISRHGAIMMTVDGEILYQQMFVR